MARRRRRNAATVTVSQSGAGVSVSAAGGVRTRRRRRNRAPGNAGQPRSVNVSVTAARGRPMRRRRNNNARTTQAVVRRALVRAGVTGPRPALTQRATATLGTVGSNQGSEVEREGSFLLNPALTKETTGSNQFGPIQVSAASYAMWKMKRCVIRVQPLVGASAVSGTIVRISLNQSATPSQASWSALGARKHVDTTPGKAVTFTITERDLCGPKEGWYFTNTRSDPAMCIGGSIDVHTFGKTMSTYQNGAFDGPLFMLEMTATWQFANYNPEQSMLALIKGGSNDGAQGARLQATPGGAVELVLPPNAALTRAVGPSRLRLARAEPSGPTVGEIIYSVVDATVTVASQLLPWPLSWIVGGGWWFIKKITGLDRMRRAAGEAVFQVYASLEDAKNNNPIIVDKAVDVELTGKEWHYQQITPGSMNITEEPAVCATLEELLQQKVDAGETTVGNWYYYKDGPPTGTPDPDKWIPKPTPGDPAFNDPTDPSKACPYWPAPLKGQAFQFSGTTLQEGFGVPVDYGVYNLIFRDNSTTGNFSQRSTAPTTNVAIKWDRGNDPTIYMFPHAVLKCASLGTTNKYNLFSQKNGNTMLFVNPEDMVTAPDTLPVVFKTGNSEVEVGKIIAGYTFVTQGKDGTNTARPFNMTHVLFKCTKDELIDPDAGPGTRWAPTKSFTFNTSNFTGTITTGYSTHTYTNWGQPIQMQQGSYYILCYFADNADPYCMVGNSFVRVPIGLTALVTNTAGQSVTWTQDDTQQFTPFGATTGIPLQMAPFVDTNYTLHGTVPANFSARRADGGINDGIVDAPTQVGAKIVSSTEAQDAEEEYDGESSEYDELPCDCVYGGHPPCPPPDVDEGHEDPPSDLIDQVDGIQIGIVNRIVNAGIPQFTAKKMVQSITPSAAIAKFKDKFFLGLYDGLSPEEARSLAYCHAKRTLEHPECLVDDLDKCRCASCETIRAEMN
nr:capsid protein [Mamastrovirus sp.]